MSKMKPPASRAQVNAFLRAVYPEATELAIASNTEGSCLRDATNLITELRRALLPLAWMSVKHLDGQPDSTILYAIMESPLKLGDVRKAKELLRGWEP